MAACVQAKLGELPHSLGSNNAMFLEYVMTMLANGKGPDDVSSKLDVFLGGSAAEFSEWYARAPTSFADLNFGALSLQAVFYKGSP